MSVGGLSAARKEPLNEFAKWLFDIARKWQEAWMQDKIFEADPIESKPKFYITAAFPYPNSPLHLGHSRTYTIADLYARFKRMQGYNVLFPMAFHYTGTPILTMAEAIANGDKELIDLMIEVYDVPPNDIEKLKDPLSLARYFHEDAKKAMIEIGYSIDWRREFTSVDPEFKSFVVWQYNKLREKGLITRGTHPVGWCPLHNMPVGMHDTKGDVEPEIGEFTLILFEHNEGYLPAATLRPETVFGVTNLWVKPNATYVKAEINGKIYIISKRSAEKLQFQRDSIRIIEEFKGEKLVGTRALNPATGRWVPILPADFVDPDTATGVVMSVPAHAPYDYVALKDLLERNLELLKKLKVSLDELKPIPLIRLEGYSEIPARDIVEKLNIKSQHDRKGLDEATKTIYSEEYHKGIVREDIVEYVYPDKDPETRKYIVAPVVAWIAGTPVSQAREATVKWLKALGYIDKMYEILNKPVYCRCGTEIVVKVLKDQWFINYGDSEWKKITYELFNSIKIVPSEIREEFAKTIEWLHERAVARTRGLGTELPWAKGWIVESLSDSTIYMAFYTVIHKIRRYKIKPNQLTQEFWDYILLGRGNADKIAKKLGISRDVLEDLRSEFEYWYPLDSRHSGRDLVPNHLTFFMFHHAALFPRDKWPRQIVTNGFVMLEGKKMSKSLRNIIPLRRAVRIYGPDTIRAAILASAELLQDANFSEDLAKSVMGQFSKLVKYVELAKNSSEEHTIADKWLLSRLQRWIEHVTENMENLKIRAASIALLYEMDNEVTKYLALRGSPGPALREYLEKWILMLTPITPHLSEELWHRLGNKTYVSLEQWPIPNKGKVDNLAELVVAYVDRVIEDIQSILKVYKGKPSKLYIVTSSPTEWKYAQRIAMLVLKRAQLREAVRELMQLGLPGKEAAQKARRLMEYMRQQSTDYLELISAVEEFDEKEAIEKLRGYIAKRTSINEIEVYHVDEAPSIIPDQKRQAILPSRPAILLK